MQPSTSERPRYGFCWWCSAKLWGRHHRVVKTHGGDVTVHVECASTMVREREGQLVR
jgi:hypothetical protein